MKSVSFPSVPGYAVLITLSSTPIVPFFLTINKQDGIAFGSLTVLLFVFLSAIGEEIIYLVSKSTLKKYRRELAHIQGG